MNIDSFQVFFKIVGEAHIFLK